MSRTQDQETISLAAEIDRLGKLGLEVRTAPETPRVSGYVLSADADFDLDEIWEYIAADNIEARRSLDWKVIRRI